MNVREDSFGLIERAIFFLARHWMTDATYARWMLRRWNGGGDIERPVTFNEKIQWLKLHDRNPIYRTLVDKYAVRQFVAQRIGYHYLNKVYGLWDNPDEIEFDALPDRFVLKVTHGSGMNLLVPDKSKLDIRHTVRQLKKWCSRDYYSIGREWAYKDLPRRVVCERLLVDEIGELPLDYKVFCFNGCPKLIQVDVDRFGNHTRAFYDTDWVKQDFQLLYNAPSVPIKRPGRLEEMLEGACALSAGIPFVRVDFYALPEIFFGEMTFYPENGLGPFRPLCWDTRLGNLIALPPLVI